MSKLLKKAAWYVQEMTASNKTSTVPLTSLPRGQNSLSDSRPAIRTRFLSRDLQQSLSLKAQRRRREGAVTRLSVCEATRGGGGGCRAPPELQVAAKKYSR